MRNRTISAQATERFVTTMTERMTEVARTLSTWVQAEPLPIQALEEQVVRVLHDLGTDLLTGLCQLVATQRPAPDVACPCGQTAHYQRMRPVQITTLVGAVTFTRAYYTCSACGHGHAPLDTVFQCAAGSLSMGLLEVLALLGATQDSFAQATEVLERLCLVQVCPNSARAAAEDLGAVLRAHDQAVVQAMETTPGTPTAVTAAPPRLYLSMDGVVTHTHEAGWKELKTGCVYTTRTRIPRQRPDQVVIRAEAQSYIAALTDAEQFGWHVWAEACRRGMGSHSELVVIGDGAHWIWNIAATHFPTATQIVDWYHASQYVWNAATTIYGDGPERTAWAHQQLDALWDGQVDQVVVALEAYRTKGDGVTAAISYYTTHRARMDYPTYRARGLQIGSGIIESTCKQLVSARLKLAGMIWDAAGAEAVAVVRAWLKSNRWHEAMRLRPPPRRAYRRAESMSMAGATTA